MGAQDGRSGDFGRLRRAPALIPERVAPASLLGVGWDTSEKLAKRFQ